MRDHLEEAMAAMTTAQQAVHVVANDVITDTSTRLAEALRPHCTLSEEDLQMVVTACAQNTATGVLTAATEVFDTMVTVVNTMRAQVEAKELPDTIPDDWET